MTPISRLASVCLIGLAIIGQIAWSKRGETADDGFAALVVRIATLGFRNDVPDASGVIMAVASACPLPIAIGMFDIDGSQDALAASLRGPTVRARYVYLGLVDERLSRRRLYARWLRASVAAMLGRRSRRAPSRYVLAAVPTACRISPG